jgi:LSD1 subclass zinc finger protein
VGVSTPTALRYLADQAGWLAHQTYAEEAFDELEHCVGVIESAIDLPTPGVYAGPCDVCRHDLYAKPGAESVECRPCHLTYDMALRREWLLSSAEDRLERSTYIARALTAYGSPVTRKRIDRWHSDGQLMHKSMDRSGHPLYRLGDVRRLVDTMPAEKKEKAG